MQQHVWAHRHYVWGLPDSEDNSRFIPLTPTTD